MEIKVNKDIYIGLKELMKQEGLKSMSAAVDYAVQKSLLPDEIIDLLSADNKSRKTQDQWISYFNNLNQRMIASYDLLKTDKITPETFRSIRQDCIDSVIITSTRNSYNPKNLSGKITHNYGSTIVTPTIIFCGSTVVKPTIIPLDNIPVYEGTSLTKVVGNSDGLKYLKALANDANAGPLYLLNNFEKLANKEADKILIWTPDQNSRAQNPERALRFLDVNGGFHVFGDSGLINDGRSRGVLKKKSGEAAAQK